MTTITRPYTDTRHDHFETVNRVRLAKVMTRKQRTWYWALAVLWLGLNVYYWTWWLPLAHTGNFIIFAVVSPALFYVFTLLPSAYLFFLGRMRRPVHVDVRRAYQTGALGRIAVISLTVPGSESLEIVKRQMLAMKRIRYPHDSWILVDKEHSPEILKIAHQLGVNYFSRHDPARWGKNQVSAWNQPTAPFAERLKRGMLTAGSVRMATGIRISLSSTSITYRSRPTWTECLDTSLIRRSPTSKGRASTATMISGQHAGHPSKNSFFKARSRWAFTASLELRSSSEVTVRTILVRSTPSAAPAHPCRGSSRHCLPRRQGI